MPLDISSGTSSTPVSCPPTHQQHSGKFQISISLFCCVCDNQNLRIKANLECSEELCNCKQISLLLFLYFANVVCRETNEQSLCEARKSKPQISQRNTDTDAVGMIWGDGKGKKRRKI
jgi:hypothetical protein